MTIYKNLNIQQFCLIFMKVIACFVFIYLIIVYTLPHYEFIKVKKNHNIIILI